MGLGRDYGRISGTLRDIFSRLYALTFSNNISVAMVFGEGWGCMRFRRTLWGVRADLWKQIQNVCVDVRLTTEEDSLVWMLSKSGIFSVQSMYLAVKNVPI